MKRFCLIFLLVIWLWRLFSGQVLAQIKINEVYPQPLTGESEWVELINVASSSVDLAGWVIEDVLNTPKTIFTFGQLLLLPGELAIASFSGQLNNAADGVTLKNPSGEVVAQMNYQTSSIGLSWSLDHLGLYQLLGPSFGMVNLSLPSPMPSPLPSPTPETSPFPSVFPIPVPININLEILKQLQLTRASICPKAGPEWLEWFNPTAQEISANLSIFDLQGNNLLIPIRLASQQKITTNLVRNIFNNSGDQVSVYYEDQLFLQKTFTGCDEAGGLWLENAVLDSGSSIESQLAGDEISALPEPDPTFIFPASVVTDLQTSLPNYQMDKVATDSGLVLGQAIDTQQDRPVWPAILMICGGFFWLGLGIIEIYGQLGFNIQALG